MSDPYYPREAEPTNLEEAIQYSYYYYCHSGFRAFLSGWCYGQGMAPVKVCELLSIRKDRLNVLATQGQLDTIFNYR
ncbi:hypothetical protein HUN41_00250 [Streptomyces phage Coruscant]|uniref:Uncharacterized protein n=1 Tax=Streptomyces phage Coruscant TaxID=2739834 RepID=A0A7G4AWE9_9CAUD|nr:hypothetical protein PP454_gp078 [Streptomyces phage Coruscant]QMP84339.1 hypothetical protein HUN41_00250 [Streptomyces phage Coruscant]